MTALLLLAGCGFQPMYGRDGAGAKAADNPLLAGVAVDPIEGRMGQILRIDLEDKLNPGGVVPADPAYRLAVSLNYSEGAIGVARDGTVSRYNVYLTSTYALYAPGDKKPMTQGTLMHVSGYNNITNEYFSTYVAQEDAIERGLSELAELYRQRLAAYLTMDEKHRLARRDAPETIPAEAIPALNPIWPAQEENRPLPR